MIYKLEWFLILQKKKKTHKYKIINYFLFFMFYLYWTHRFLILN